MPQYCRTFTLALARLSCLYNYVGQIRIWCILIARRYDSAVYVVVVCGVNVAYQQLSDWTRLYRTLNRIIVGYTHHASPFSVVRGGDATLLK